MNWQEFAAVAIVIAAVIYAGRIFLQQFSLGKKADAEQCAHCGPNGKAGQKPVPSTTENHNGLPGSI